MRRKAKWTSNLKWLEALLVIFLVSAVVINLYLNNIQGSNSKQLSSLKSSRDNLESRIISKKDEINININSQALLSDNPTIKMSATQLSATNKATSLSEKVFPILLDYRSVDDYKSRKNESSKYLASSILNDQDIFSTKKSDWTYIKESGLRSEYKGVVLSAGILKGNTLPVLLKVHYYSWFSNQHRSDMQDLYVGEYSYSQNKFIQLKRLSNLFTGAVNED